MSEKPFQVLPLDTNERTVHTNEGFNSGMKVIIVQGNNDPEYIRYQVEIEKIKQQGEFLNYDIDNIEGWRSFSLMDERDKYTERLVDCTGIVIFGKSKDSDKIISCIAHTDAISAISEKTDVVKMAKDQSSEDSYRAQLVSEILDLNVQLDHTLPDEEMEVFDDNLEMDLYKNKVEYLRHRLEYLKKEMDRLEKEHAPVDYFLTLDNEIQQSLSKFKELVDLTTVSASIIGGQVLKEDRAGTESDVVKLDENLVKKGEESYALAVRLWKDYIIASFDIEPSIAHEPLMVRGRKHGTDVYVDTQGKKIFVVYRTAQSN
jgi:hypothetical protein